MGNKIIIGAVVLCVVLIAWARLSVGNVSQTAASSDSEVISADGIHWHPKLSISVRGEPAEIPANVGLIGGHSPMHTHETDGIIHLEFNSVVREDDIRLGRFFELWGKPFNENQLFEHTNVKTKRVRMFVNGEPNTEYEDYVLQPEDEIEIRYE